jgi:hypothetical protein
VEYWIDVDPGFDNATTISGLTSSTDVQYLINLPISLPIGLHTLGIRSKDAHNVWSHTNFIPVNVVDSSNGKIVQVEFFWDNDPGFGNGNDSILNNPTADITNGLFTDSVSPTFMLGSNHILFARSKDSRGRWGHTNYINNMMVIACNDYVDLLDQSKVSIYPNPFHDFVKISPVINESTRIIFYDATGRKIFDKLIDQEEKVDMHNFSSGIYYVYVWTQKNKIYQTKIIKQ